MPNGKRRSVRKEMGKRPSATSTRSSSPRHAGAEVRRADELTSLAKLENSTNSSPGPSPRAHSLSARGTSSSTTRLRPPGRTQSDIAHEVAHLMLKH